MPLPLRAAIRSPARVAVLAILVLGGRPAIGLAQDDDEDPYLPGLVAEFRDAKGNTARRTDHQLSFHWNDTSPDPRLAAGEFRATWRGRLQVQARGDYRFGVFGTGEVSLK